MMAIKMRSYFSQLRLWLSTGSITGEVVSYGSADAEVRIKDKVGEELLILQEQHLRDMLNACRRARHAAKIADAATPIESREES